MLPRLLSAAQLTFESQVESQAEELFLEHCQGSGYHNTTGRSPREAKEFNGGKAGPCHRDTGAGAYPRESSHLQVHTREGPVVRIFFPD